MGCYFLNASVVFFQKNSAWDFFASITVSVTHPRCGVCLREGIIVRELGRLQYIALAQSLKSFCLCRIIETELYSTFHN